MACLRRICVRSCHLLSTKKCLRLLVVLLLLVAVFSYYNLFFLLTTNHLEDTAFVGISKCPACYGTSMCHEFRHGHLTLSSYSRVRIFDVVNVKNVFDGWHNEKRINIILKKLGHDDELAKFDRNVCKRAGMGEDCDVSEGIFKTNFARVIETDTLEASDAQGLSDVVRCPSQRLLQRIVARFSQHVQAEKLSKDHKMMLMTTLVVNPEPIMYLIFPQSEGWPFPQYYGACGRFIVEEYIGQTLGEYFNADWSQRLDLAYQVMRIAELLTNNEAEFALYITDVTFNNFAVNNQGKVFIIDAENIIVVDKQKIKADAKPQWNERHQSFHDECKSHPGCLSFSSELLCKRHSSDHNYYAMCHGLLAVTAGPSSDVKGGLLHDYPTDLPEVHELNRLIAECEKPSQQNGRYDAMQQLLQLLAKLTGNIH